MEVGTDSLAILFVIVFATLITYTISDFNPVTMFPGLITIGAFVVMESISESKSTK